MPKTFRLTAALSIALLTLVAGCSVQSNSPRASANKTESATETGNLLALAQKPAIPSIASPDPADRATQQKIEQYFNGFENKGFAKKSQGMWIQAGNILKGQNKSGAIAHPPLTLSSNLGIYSVPSLPPSICTLRSRKALPQRSNRWLPAIHIS